MMTGSKHFRREWSMCPTSGPGFVCRVTCDNDFANDRRRRSWISWTPCLTYLPVGYLGIVMLVQRQVVMKIVSQNLELEALEPFGFRSGRRPISHENLLAAVCWLEGQAHKFPSLTDARCGTMLRS